MDHPAITAFADTLFPLAHLTQEEYERLDPYFGYTSLMGSTQGYMHRAEYIGKRLCGRNAVQIRQRIQICIVI